jgi:hypothetical protein
MTHYRADLNIRIYPHLIVSDSTHQQVKGIEGNLREENELNPKADSFETSYNSDFKTYKLEQKNCDGLLFEMRPLDRTLSKIIS